MESSFFLVIIVLRVLEAFFVICVDPKRFLSVAAYCLSFFRALQPSRPDLIGEPSKMLLLLIRFVSGWADLNCQPLAPHASTLPIAPHPDFLGLPPWRDSRRFSLIGVAMGSDRWPHHRDGILLC